MLWTTPLTGRVCLHCFDLQERAVSSTIRSSFDQGNFLPMHRHYSKRYPGGIAPLLQSTLDQDGYPPRVSGGARYRTRLTLLYFGATTVPEAIGRSLLMGRTCRLG